MKLIKRGSRVQGLAFAQGREAGAPGCGASRIHPRCKKAALEQRFGPCPFTPEQPPRPNRSGIRDRAEREAHAHPRWALRDAQRIVDHARMRSEYAAYRERFFADRRHAQGARWDAAWELERARRQRDAQRRREARLLLRAAARLSTRGRIARQLAYWSIEAVMNRRRAREYDAGRVRWEAAKIALNSERRLMREEKPMEYRAFVAQRARAGDLGAQRVLDRLGAPGRSPQDHPAEPQVQRLTVEQIRGRLQIIRTAEEARYEQAQAQRQQLTRIDRPPTLEQALEAARRGIQEHVSVAAQCTPAERAQLARLAKEEQSWNPFTRHAAKKEAARLRAGQQARYAETLRKAMSEFENGDAERIQRRVLSDERIYREYVNASLGLEAQMRQARAAMRDEIPKVEKQLLVLERAGVSQVECESAAWRAPLDHLTAAVGRAYRGLPDAVRRDLEFAIRREVRTLERTRASMSMER